MRFQRKCPSATRFTSISVNSTFPHHSARCGQKVFGSNGSMRSQPRLGSCPVLGKPAIDRPLMLLKHHSISVP